jgi:replicative superfamily II helicase
MTTSPPTLDLTGLSPEAIRQVQELADWLRANPPAAPPRPAHLREGETPEQWIERFDAWQATLKPRNPNVDDSRDSIYD